MRRANYKPYFLLAIVFFVLLNLPQKTVEGMRYAMVCCVSPTWKMMSALKNFFASSSYTFSSSDRENSEMQSLRLENQILRGEIENLREWILYEARLHDLLEKIREVSGIQEKDSFWKEFFKRRNEQLKNRFELEMQALPAKVIFRDPSSWSSSIWINVGEKDNKSLGKAIVSKNSPVVVGDSIVGVVEFVAEKKSRVRLITDSGLVPSVRALRGEEQNRAIRETVETLLSQIKSRGDLFDSPDKEKIIFQSLQFLQEKLFAHPRDVYLAKGELCGTSEPLWRCHANVLKGMGFNYDFGDEEGPARDLRSGEVLPHSSKEAIPLLQVGDLLVTTGMDGVFPAGYRVGVVTSIGNLREGGCSYEMEASVAAGNIRELVHVFVLPPLSTEGL